MACFELISEFPVLHIIHKQSTFFDKNHNLVFNIFLAAQFLCYLLFFFYASTESYIAFLFEEKVCANKIKLL